MQVLHSQGGFVKGRRDVGEGAAVSSKLQE